MKAAFLYNFGRFVEWPPTAPDEDFAVTVLGADPFGRVLDETLRAKTLGGRRVVVRRIARIEEVGRSRVLFIGDTLSGRLPETLRRIHAQPILTVGEMEDFNQAGGMIRLRTEGNRIRFDINPKPAREAGLKFSSELLKLARIVE